LPFYLHSLYFISYLLFQFHPLFITLPYSSLTETFNVLAYITQNHQKITCFPRTGNPAASDMEGRRMCVVHHKKEDGRVTLESKPMRSRLIKEGLSGGTDGGWKI